MSKKGLSPIIATAMLITLTLVLASIVFLWARGFISEQIQKFGQPVERQCDNIEWKISYRSSSPAKARYFDISNNGNININSINLKIISGNNEKSENYKLNLNIGQADSLILDTIIEGKEAEKVIFYPVLLGSSRDGTSKGFPCENQGKVINFI